MNQEEAKQLLPIITAFAEGKTIQCRATTGSEWVSMIQYNFMGPPENYRIKPEPREFSIWVSKDGETVLHSQQPEQYGYGKGYDLIKVREILD